MPDLNSPAWWTAPHIAALAVAAVAIGLVSGWLIALELGHRASVRKGGHR